MSRRAFDVSLEVLSTRLGLPPSCYPTEIQIHHLKGTAVIVVHDPERYQSQEGGEPRREPLPAPPMVGPGGITHIVPCHARASVNTPVVVYIAGPFRNASAWAREQNIRRAEELALAVWRMGAVALCPHTNARHFQDALPDDVWLAGDLELLRRCDGILLMRDWARSAGAMTERNFAEQLDIPIFEDIDILERWLAVKRAGLLPEDRR